MALVWASLAVGLVLPAIGIVVVVRRTIALWRDLKRSGKVLVEAMDSVGERLAATSAAAEAAGAAPSRTEPSLERLRVSLARLAVLRTAVSDVRGAAARATAVYPRK